MRKAGKHRAETAPRDIGHSLREVLRHIGDVRDRVHDVGAESRRMPEGAASARSSPDLPA